jgi:hypothetical protein
MAVQPSTKRKTSYRTTGGPMKRLLYFTIAASLAFCTVLAVAPGTASAATSVTAASAARQATNPNDYLAIAFSHSMNDEIFWGESRYLDVAEGLAYNECLRTGNVSSYYANDCHGEAWVQHGYLDAAVTQSYSGGAWALGWDWSWNRGTAWSRSQDECLADAGRYGAPYDCVVTFRGSTPYAAYHAGRAQTRGGSW